MLHFAEFGVVMMLFLIGLELQPSLLWRLRGAILGLGGLQVGITAAAITAIGIAFAYQESRSALLLRASREDEAAAAASGVNGRSSTPFAWAYFLPK